MKKKFMALLAASVCIAGAMGLSACSSDKPAAHTCEWSEWTVSEENEPGATATGKATRTCTGTGDCNAAATDKEYTLPELTSTDYIKSADTATCSAKGVIKYTYNKNGVNVNFDIDTPVNASAHKYGAYQKAETASEGHYQVCEHNGAHKTEVVEHDTDGKDGACSKCGYKETDENPTAHEHTAGDWVNTDPEEHYKLCTDENCPNPTEKISVGGHDTEGEDGACSVCGYKASAEIPPTPSHTDHTWGDWTVTDANKPTKVMPGKATRSCTYEGCGVADEEEVELPPLASTLEYNITDNTATCTEGGTATYTYKENTEISFSAAADAKGHNYGDTQIVDGVPIATCSDCGNKLPAELSSTINPSVEKTTFFAGGNLEYTLTAYSGAVGYYTFSYEGEQEIQVAYNYYSLKDGEVSGTVALSGAGKTMFTVFLETRATCTMVITSSEEAFIGEMSLTFSVTDPSYVMPEIYLGLTTVSASYYGTTYGFTAPTNGSYTLSCESEEAEIMLADNGGTESILKLPYTFDLEKDETITFVMSCSGEESEFDVKVELGLSGSGTYSDPYIVTEDFLAVNIGATLKNGETKYYKIAMSGSFLLNCFPLESEGTRPTFLSDDYTAEEYTQELIVNDEKITVTGWKVTGITCDDDGYVFALRGSGINSTDNVQLYFNYVYGTEENPYSWDYIYFFIDYKAFSNFNLGDTAYINLVPTVTGRITVSFAHISTVKMGGEILTEDGTPFELFVVKGETYLLECTTSYLINGVEQQRESYKIQVASSGNSVSVYPGTGVDCYENDILMWWNYTTGTFEIPHKTISLLKGDRGEFELFANDSSYVRISESSYVTFTFGDGITANFKGKEILSGVRYAFEENDKIEFVNSGEVSTLSYVLAESIGQKTNPFLLFERREGLVTVEANSSYYIQTKGAFEMSFTFTGVTVTWNGTEIESGNTYTVALGDEIVLINNGDAAVDVEYETLALFGTRYNPDTLEIGTAKEISKEIWLNLTISGDKTYHITASDFATPYIKVNGVGGVMLTPTSDEYALYGVVIQYNNNYYAFNSDGVLCEVSKSYQGEGGTLTAIHYGGSMNGNACVAKDEGTPLVLSAGTHFIRIIKNPGDSTVLEEMSIGCTLSVSEVSAPVTTYTVTFVTNKDGVTVQEQEIKEGETATIPTAPEYEGFRFMGWYTDEELTAPFDFTTPITAHKILYADWEPVAPPQPATEGTEENPFVAKSGANGGTTTEDDYYTDNVGTYLKYYVYEVETDGTVTIGYTAGTNSVVGATTASFEETSDFPDGYYTFTGDAESFTLEVKAKDTLYILAGRFGEAGEYSFDLIFVASEGGEGDGSENNPFVAKSGANGGTTTEDDYYSETAESYLHYYVYEVETDGTVTIGYTAGTNSVVGATTTSFETTSGFPDGYYALIGDVESFTLEVKAKDTLYILAGCFGEAGEYSFDLIFVASEGGEGDGSENNPFVAKSGANGGTTTEDDYYSETAESYLHYYVYEVETDGTVTIGYTAGTNSVVGATTASFETTSGFPDGYYALIGDAESFTLEVKAEDTLYILAGCFGEAGEYSFDLIFVASEGGEGDGSENNPFVAKSGANGGTTTEDDYYSETAESYLHYYVYEVETDGTVTIGYTAGTNSVVGATTASFETTSGFPDGYYALIGDAESFTLEVKAEDTLYILAGRFGEAGEYSFDIVFTAD